VIGEVVFVDTAIVVGFVGGMSVVLAEAAATAAATEAAAVEGVID